MGKEQSIKKESRSQTNGMASVMERNIKTLIDKRRQEDNMKTMEQRLVDKITRFTGRMSFVYIHLVLFGTWVAWNAGWLGIKPFDPSFFTLAMCASVEAIFLSTFVLISQNQMNIQEDKRADLNLQISLLTEHEVTRLITLVTAIAKKMEIDEADHWEIEELKQEVNPEKVMDTMEGIKSAGRKTKG